MSDVGFTFHPSFKVVEGSSFKKKPRRIAELLGKEQGYLYVSETTEPDQRQIWMPSGYHLKLLPPRLKDRERDVIMVVGGSGAGKSWWTIDYAIEYHKIFPKNKIFVVSSKLKDDSMDGRVPFKRLSVESLVNDPIERDEALKHMAYSLVIFDDCEGLSKAESKAVEELERWLLVLARDRKISVIITNHLACRGHRTSLMLAECNRWVVFSQGGLGHLNYLLKSKLGYATKKIDEVAELLSKTRWLAIDVEAPQYFLWQEGAKIV